MNKQIYSIIFSSLLFLLLSWTAWEALSFHKLARYFPLYISLVAALISLINLMIQIKKYVSNRDQSTQENPKFNLAPLKYIAWIVGYVVLIFLAGFIIGTVIFLFSFLRFETRLTIIKTAFSTAITIGILILFGNLMNLYWPLGLVGKLF